MDAYARRLRRRHGFSLCRNLCPLSVPGSGSGRPRGLQSFDALSPPQVVRSHEPREQKHRGQFDAKEIRTEERERNLFGVDRCRAGHGDGGTSIRGKDVRHLQDQDGR